MVHPLTIPSGTNMNHDFQFLKQNTESVEIDTDQKKKGTTYNALHFLFNLEVAPPTLP